MDPICVEDSDSESYLDVEELYGFDRSPIELNVSQSDTKNQTDAKTEERKIDKVSVAKFEGNEKVKDENRNTIRKIEGEGKKYIEETNETLMKVTNKLLNLKQYILSKISKMNKGKTNKSKSSIILITSMIVVLSISLLFYRIQICDSLVKASKKMGYLYSSFDSGIKCIEKVGIDFNKETGILDE